MRGVRPQRRRRDLGTSCRDISVETAWMATARITSVMGGDSWARLARAGLSGGEPAWQLCTCGHRRVYTGAWQKGHMSGNGTMTWPDGMGPEPAVPGSKYEGEYKNDFRHGHGTLIWPDGPETQRVAGVENAETRVQWFMGVLRHGHTIFLKADQTSCDDAV
eukprot:Skav215741  [mRNA]  locus=scaffold106:1906:3432:- [translate_table: standard]